jgi:hypothetical protein
MRKDMFKVIVERPRSRVAANRGLHSPARRLKNFVLDEDGEVIDARGGKLGMKKIMRGQPKVIRKYLNENLNPLRRYFDKQVGRKWGDVYSEVCENLNPNSTVMQHVRDHVKDFVIDRPTWTIDGKVYYIPEYNYSRQMREITEDDLYVDNAGYLRRGPGVGRAARNKERAAARLAENNKDKVVVTAAFYFKKENGIWFKYVTTEVWKNRTTWVRDEKGKPVMKEDGTYEFVLEPYKEDLTRRYTANKKEIRDYGLKKAA